MNLLNPKEFFLQAGIDIDYATTLIEAVIDGKMNKALADTELAHLRELGYQLMLLAVSLEDENDA